MSNWWWLAFVVWTVFVWFVGRADGRSDEKEKYLLKDFDRVIEEVRQRLAAPVRR